MRVSVSEVTTTQLRKGEMTLLEVNTVLSIECGKGEETSSFTTAAITACEEEDLELPAQDIEEKVTPEDVPAEDVSLTLDSLVSIDLSDDAPLPPAAHVLLDVHSPPAYPILAPPAFDCSDVSKTFVNVPLDEMDEVKSTAADELAIETTVQVTQTPEPELPSIHQVQVPDAEAVPPADSEDKEIVQPVVKAVHRVKVHYSKPVTVQAPAKKPVLASNLLKDLKVDKKLGSGGFGAVYAVTHKKTGVRYALKVMSKTRKDPPKEHHQAIEGHLMRVAVQETFALHRTAGVVGVVDLVASTYDSLNFYHVLPLYEGGDLANEIARCGSFPDVKARFYIAEIVQAVAALHDEGLIHRDLKPGNILLSTNGHAVIADLGLAKAFTTKRCAFELESYERYFPMLTEGENDAKGVTKTRCGTPEYMAPELCAGQLYDCKVDVFAMGLILFEMLVGVLPQELPDWDGDLTRVSDQYGISEHAEDFIAEALAELPGDRPTAKELMKFEIFDGCDWDELRDQEVYEGWLPVSDSEESDGNPITFVPGEPIDPAMDFLPFLNFQSPQFSQLPSSATALPTAVSDHELPTVAGEDSLAAEDSIGSLNSIALLDVNVDQTPSLALDVKQEPEPEVSLLWDAFEVERSPSPCAVSDPLKSSLPSIASTQDCPQLPMPLSSSNTSQPWAISTYSDSLSLPAHGSQLEAPSVPISYSSDNDSRPWALCALGTAQSSSIQSPSITDKSNCVASGVSSPCGSPSYCPSEGGFSASAAPNPVPTSFNTLIDDDSSCIMSSTITTRLSLAKVNMSDTALAPSSGTCTSNGPSVAFPSANLKKISLVDQHHAPSSLDPTAVSSVATTLPPLEPVISPSLLSGVTLSSGFSSGSSFADNTSNPSPFNVTRPRHSLSSPSTFLRDLSYTRSMLPLNPMSVFGSLVDFAGLIWNRVTSCLLRLLL
ncbi:kinase-like domain-containing protein [Cristinia sonorae]|uniref:non-specific serine/threonine protein kinase n=1 Tax=Cristinia sonorae TaxID=1940300 RepID=A0A8K0UPN8_9AGAR|nr:kinase-like domain-containing protein [Cristinia sonorae]